MITGWSLSTLASGFRVQGLGERLQVFVELIDQRDRGGDVEPRDLVFWDVVQVLHLR